ncbi:hypothetical protein C2E23DRAFT_805408 [Lenzites betulinus]|nr:hypothetical protein C2E23DRAFT_836102 [Lenzites betulinus]KAH9857700.1 hypothetical protein C2E23DRAFT_805408 [Lenzites betulinus]
MRREAGHLCFQLVLLAYAAFIRIGAGTSRTLSSTTLPFPPGVRDSRGKEVSACSLILATGVRCAHTTQGPASPTLRRCRHGGPG